MKDIFKRHKGGIVGLWEEGEDLGLDHFWLLTSCVTLGKSFNFSDPQVPFLENGGNDTYVIKNLWGATVIASEEDVRCSTWPVLLCYPCQHPPHSMTCELGTGQNMEVFCF